MLRNNLGLFSQIWTLFGQIFRNFLKMFPKKFYAIFQPKMTIWYIFHQILPKNPRKFQEKNQPIKISKNRNRKYNNNHNFQFLGKFKNFLENFVKSICHFESSNEKMETFEGFFKFCEFFWKEVYFKHISCLLRNTMTSLQFIIQNFLYFWIPLVIM